MSQPQRSGTWLSRNSVSQPGGFFPHAHNFQIKDSHFFDASQNVHYHNRKGLERLEQYISKGALHDSRERSPQPMCHPNTRQEVLKIIMDWVQDSHSRQPIIWLNGPAGAGKSAIAQKIAERCLNNQLAASFFFLRNSLDRGSATLLFTTLAWQLAKNIPEILPYIESAVEAEPLLPTKSIDIQFDGLIVQPFQKLLHDKHDFRPTTSLVIIDGVDECAPDRDQLQLLELIGNALSNAQIPLRFLMCSRAEAHIQERFESDVVANITYKLTLDHHFSPDVDIRRFLEEEFARICTERKPSSSTWPPDGAIDQLVSKSSGQFIYPSTVVKFVGDTDGDPTTQLNIVLKTRPADFSSPFAELDLLYIQILSQQPDTRLLRDLFTLIIALRGPDIAFVCRRLRISKEELKLKLRRLYSLVRISELVINTYHLSLHDFFCDKKRAGKYFIHPVRVACVRLPLTTRPAARVAMMIMAIACKMVLTGVAIVLALPFLPLGIPAYCFWSWIKSRPSRQPHYQDPIMEFEPTPSAICPSQPQYRYPIIPSQPPPLFYNPATCGGYDESLLREAPAATREQLQEGYNPDILIAPMGHKSVRQQPPLHSTPPGTAPPSLPALSRNSSMELGNVVPVGRSFNSYDLTNDMPRKVLFWETRKGILFGGIIVALVIIGAVIGEAVRDTVGKKKTSKLATSSSLTGTVVQAAGNSPTALETVQFTSTSEGIPSITFTVLPSNTESATIPSFT